MHLSLNPRSRSRVLVGGLLLIGAIFIIRLFIMQVIQHADYVARAEELQVGKFTITPKRGEIFAKDGGAGAVPLVMNVPVYTAYADPAAVEDPAKIEAMMRRIAGGSTRDGFEEDLKDDELRYTVLARQLNRDQAELIKKENLPGVGLQEGTKRVYPEGSLAATTLGFVDTAGEGQYGIEGALDERLQGTPGILKSVTDVRRIPLTIGTDDENIRKPARDGDDLVLNIDRNVQSYAEAALKRGLERVKATEGSVLVMDPNTGQVMAMANYPSYDPAKYFETSDYSRYLNRVVSQPYEAGSVVKTLTMGVGLDSGAVDYNTTFNDSTGCVFVDGIKICNVEEDPKTSAATMTDTLHYSLNTGVVFILKQMGGGTINEAARKKLYTYWTDHFLFGSKTGIEQMNESAGTIVPPTDGAGLNVQYANMTFGQGMETTMIQTASAFSAAINGGTYYRPQLVAGVRGSDGTFTQKEPEVVRSGVMSPEASETLRKMVYDGRRLGILGKTDKDGYIVGGKTGTSQIIDPETGEYIDENSIGSYLGYGGGERPEYVIMVRVMDSKAPGYAGTVAAGPIFGDISNWLLDYMQVEPVRRGD